MLLGPTLRAPILMLLLGPVGLWACADEAGECGSAVCLFKTEAKALRVDTQLDRASMTAGDTVRVVCVVHYDDGATRELAPPEISVSLTPEAGGTFTAPELRITRTGDYKIACALDAVEATTADLTVKAAAAARTVASLERETVASGEMTDARCRVEDEHGNMVQAPGELRIALSPSDGVSVTDFTISAFKVGAYQVACAVSGLNLERVPATLTVTTGAPLSIQVTLSTAAARAGDRVDVLCSVADRAGNAITAPTTFEVTPAPTTVDATGLIANTAGEYSVVCRLASPSLVSLPARLVVGAGPVALIEIQSVTPAMQVYPHNATVEVAARMTDAFGNEALNGQWDLVSDPTTATAYSGPHRLQLTGNGTIRLIARVTSATANGATVEDDVTVLADGDVPVVVIDYPQRGEIITRTPGQAITISGHATDPTSGIASFTIQGNNVALGPNGAFSTTFVPTWGINVFEGIAIDEAGNSRELAQAFELASSYRQASPSRITSARIDDGLMVRLSQAALDDNFSDVDDLATIARLAIQQLNIVSLIPNPVTTYNSDCSVLFVTITGALRLHVDSVNFGTPIIDITAINGGIHLRAEIPNLSVQMHTSGDVCDIGIGISGTTSAQRAIVEGDIYVSTWNGGIDVSMPSPAVTLQGFNINLNLPGIIDWAVDGIISLFSGAIASRIQSALASAIRGEVPGVVDDFLTGVQIGTGVTLPAPISLPVGVSARLGSLVFAPGGGNLGFDTTVYATGAMSPEPPGGILQEYRYGAALSGRGTIAIGIAYDLINQALYSIWYGGALDLNLAQFIPGQLASNGQMINVGATARAMLPPVLSPSGDPSFPIQLAIGDLEIALDLTGIQGLPPIAATLYASAFAKANVSVSGNGQITFSLAPAPRVVIDFQTPLADVLDTAALVTQLEDMLSTFLPDLFNQAIQGIPIPTIDLSALAGPALPPGIRLGIGSPSAEVQSSYLVLGGNLVQVP